MFHVIHTQTHAAFSPNNVISTKIQASFCWSTWTKILTAIPPLTTLSYLIIGAIEKTTRCPNLLELLNDSIGIKGAIGIFSNMHKRLNRHLNDALGHLPIIYKRIIRHLNDAMGYLSIIPKRLNWHLKDAMGYISITPKRIRGHIKDAVISVTEGLSVNDITI